MAIDVLTPTEPAASTETLAWSVPASHPHVVLGSIPIFDGSLDEAIAYCMEALRRGVGARIATANLDFFALARSNNDLLADLQRSSIVVADGAPVVALSRLAGAQRVQRTTGVDLALALCREGGQRGTFRVVLYGSDHETAARAAVTLQAASPGVEIPLILNPPYRPLTAEEQADELAAIAACDPHLVLVALGCPKQEQRIREYYEAAPQALWIGVGGALDFYAGKRRRAAPVFQRLGLEWAVRLAQEPRRLASRYLGRDLPVVPSLLVEALAVRLGVRRSGIEPT